jgi:hypothetical protein
MDKAITTCCLPLNRVTLSNPKVPVHLSTTPMYKETTHTPGTQPYGLTGKGYGQTQRNYELPPQLNYTSTHTNHMND